MVLWICAVVVIAVFAVMLYSYATFRRGTPSGQAADRVIRRSALVETLWAIVPIAIMVGTALPAVRQLLVIHPSIDQGSSAAASLQAHRQDFP